LENVAIRWATDGAEGPEDFLLAIKVDAHHFQVFHRLWRGIENRVFRLDRSA
jgi:hypothetical protein